MFGGLMRQHDIATKYRLSSGYIAHLAMRGDFPPVEMRIGSAPFYNAEAVDFFFAEVKDKLTVQGNKRRRAPKRKR